MNKRNTVFASFFAFFFLNFVADLFAGTCALCKQSLAIGGTDGLVQGIYLSILLIAGMPFLIFTFFYVSYRVRARKRRKESLVPADYHFDI